MAPEEPASYRTLEPGSDVISADGERIGTVEHVLADDELDVFDGLVVDVVLGPGGHRFVDASQVADLSRGRVVLTVSAAEAHRLPEPAPGPAVMEHHGVEDSESALEHKLRRAWEIVSGKG